MEQPYHDGAFVDRSCRASLQLSHSDILRTWTRCVIRHTWTHSALSVVTWVLQYTLTFAAALLYSPFYSQTQNCSLFNPSCCINGCRCLCFQRRNSQPDVTKPLRHHSGAASKWTPPRALWQIHCEAHSGSVKLVEPVQEQSRETENNPTDNGKTSGKQQNYTQRPLNIQRGALICERGRDITLTSSHRWGIMILNKSVNSVTLTHFI